MLVTSRLRPGLRSLRWSREALCIRHAITLANANEDFRVVHHSIQSNHLHLILEASDRAALSNGVRALLMRIAHGLNRLWGRRGSITHDRHHERELQSPRAVRNALVYVLQNLRKHGVCLRGADPLSSAPAFTGWKAPYDEESAWGSQGPPGARSVRATRVLAQLVASARAASAEPRTWMLTVGWRRHGLIDPRELPARG